MHLHLMGRKWHTKYLSGFVEQLGREVRQADVADFPVL